MWKSETWKDSVNLRVSGDIGHVLNENMLDVISQQRQDINNLAANKGVRNWG